MERTIYVAVAQSFLFHRLVEITNLTLSMSYKIRRLEPKAFSRSLTYSSMSQYVKQPSMAFQQHFYVSARLE